MGGSRADSAQSDQALARASAHRVARPPPLLPAATVSDRYPRPPLTCAGRTQHAAAPRRAPPQGACAECAAAGPGGVMAALVRPLRGVVAAALRALPWAAGGGAARSGAGTEVARRERRGAAGAWEPGPGRGRPGAAGAGVTRDAYRIFYGSLQVLGKGFRRGVALSAGSFLVYEACGLISRFAEVHASSKVEEVVEQADYLYGSGETEKLYRLLVQHKTSEDAELLWRLARASRDLAQLSSTSAEEKKQLVYEALEYAKKALEKNASNFAAHKWYAICISDVGDYEGIKAKIANAFVIKEHFQRAIELNPKDATSIHLMGIWCYSFADMPWYQRKIAAMLFATPPTSTYKEALRYFHMAEEADPNFYSKNLLYLGKTYLKLNNKKMALLWLSKAKEYPAHTEEDKQVQKEALELLNSI
ncbi:regulator of microtubule dynamics protein 1 [Eudromia elegans]